MFTSKTRGGSAVVGMHAVIMLMLKSRRGRDSKPELDRYGRPGLLLTQT